MYGILSIFHRIDRTQRASICFRVIINVYVYACTRQRAERTAHTAGGGDIRTIGGIVGDGDGCRTLIPQLTNPHAIA